MGSESGNCSSEAYVRTVPPSTPADLGRASLLCTGQDRQPSDAEPDQKLMRRVVALVGLGTLMTALDTTVISVALLTLSQELHGSVADVQWVVTSYLLGMAAVVPVSGWAARRFGARRIYAWALGVFAVSSGLCALADSLPMLALLRMLQGFGGGFVTPVGQLITAEVAGPKRTGRMLSRIWMVSSLGSILGPSLGGAILSALGWRWIFLINLPIGGLGSLVAFRLLPATPARAAGRLDVNGLIRLAVGLPAVVFALTQAAVSGTPVAAETLVPLVIGAVLVADFVRHALSLDSPLVDLRLYARRTFGFGTASTFSINVAWFIALILLPLFLQQVRHATPTGAGLLMAPQGLGSAMGMWLAGRARDVRTSRWVGVGGAVTFVATSLSLATPVATNPDWVIFPILFMAGLAAAMAWVAATAVSYSELDPEEISHATPLITMSIRLAGSFGTAIGAVVLQHALAANRSAAGSGHLIAAYHVSFRWAAGAGLVAIAVFLGLCRAVGRNFGGPPPRTRVEIEPTSALG
jgi:EmrB/QacA subfamily drug resistance transporter